MGQTGIVPLVLQVEIGVKSLVPLIDGVEVVTPPQFLYQCL